MTIKHPQTIIAVDAEMVCRELDLQQGFNAVSYERFLEILPAAIITRQRNYLDNRETTKADVVASLQWYAGLHGIDLNFPNLSLVPEFEYKGDRRVLQLLPYRVVIESHDDGKRIALYQRAEGGGEVRLLDAISCGYGGHPDLVDLRTEGHLQADVGIEHDAIDEIDWSIVVPKETLELSAEREFAEEVLVENNPEQFEHSHPFFEGLILDRSDEVGNIHLAVVYSIQLPHGATAHPKEAQLLPVPAMRPEDALRDLPGLESWSKLVARHFVAKGL